MIPYFHLERISIAGTSVSSFVLLASLGCLVACAITVLRGKRHGIPVERTEEVCLWAILAAYLGAHAGPWLTRPAVLLSSPGLFFKTGLSSFGGFAGGLLGICAFFAWRRVRGAERWRFLDAIAFSLPFGGMLGRLGCTLVHDHPGVRTESWLAVRYPDFPRFDLGLLEFLFLSAVGLVFLVGLPRRFFGMFFLLYGLFRAATATLRIDPPRYAGWTLDQYAGAAAVALGTWAIFRQLGSSERTC